MNLSSIVRRPKSSLLARVVAFVLAVAVMAALSNIVTHDIRLATGNAPADDALLAHFLAWALWLGLLWAWLGLRRALLTRLAPRTWVRVLVEVGLCAGYAFLSIEATQAAMNRVIGPPTLPAGLSVADLKPMMITRAAMLYAFAVVALVAITGEVKRRRSVSDAKELLLQRETLERQLTEARLETLQSQLHPHFLFNALHAIGGLILTADKQRAHRALASLSTLLRQSLKQGVNQTTTVEEEVELVSQYVELERLRFGDRMRFSIDAAPDVLHASVPALILLPIVENAVTHGLEPLPGGGQIELRIARKDDALELCVIDDGVGRSGERTRSGTGIGLKNTAGRLEALYGPSASVTVEESAPRGTRVCIQLPLQKAASSSGERVAS
ncbi:MAG: histidine kinase [Planctomycetota bacterium]